jgi:hypothetical protein
VRVDLHSQAEAELASLPEAERYAMQNAIEKLELFGDRLPFPHSSRVKGAAQIRELRPRTGRSRWRAFYRRFGGSIVVASIGPEAQVDPRGFRRAVADAAARLTEIEQERNNGDKD